MLRLFTLITLALATVAQAQDLRVAPAMSIQDIVRLDGQGRTQLRGLGLVVGLRGTGDSGAELAIARPLAELHRSNGNPIERLEDLGKAKSAAVVLVTCEIPEQGARVNDTFDVTVSALHTATSLQGGQLVISPLMGPLPGQPVFAYARGGIILEDENTPTVGRVVAGGQLVSDILMALDRSTFKLFIRTPYRGWHTADLLAGQINDITSDFESDQIADPVATVLDHTAIRIDVPLNERRDPARFIAGLMTHKFSPTLLDLPAKVIVNNQTGSIVVTADVEIASVSLTHRNLAITITNPAPEPNPNDPIVSQETWTQFGSTTRDSDKPRIMDLLAAFEQLDVPIEDQISLLRQIHRSGHLLGQFEVDG